MLHHVAPHPGSLVDLSAAILASHAHLTSTPVHVHNAGLLQHHKWGTHTWP